MFPGPFTRRTAFSLVAMAGVPGGLARAGSAETEPGFPVRSEAVRRACGACHPADANGALSRISWRRTSPEGWQETIKRMATLNQAPLQPALAREALRYLANEQGLAPEEAKAGRFEVERRHVEFRYADAATERACGICHSTGRVLLQRRSREEWDLLVAMHRGYYPLVDFQAFRFSGPPPDRPGKDGAPPDRRHPVDKALDHLKATFPLRTPEWSAWTANRRPPRLAGRWALSGLERGHGPIFGEVVIEAVPGKEDEFVTRTSWARAAADRPAPAAAPALRRGEAVVYAGFEWRGRSRKDGALSGEDDPLREVLSLDRDGRTLSGRFFAGGYDERGLDVTLTRVGAEPLVLGLWPRALRTGTAVSVLVHGVGLAGLPAAELDLGPGVRVRAVTPEADGLRLELDVEAQAPVGERDLRAGGLLHRNAAVVFGSVDALKVVPEPGLARVGGIRAPKRFEQFEARASSHGADGKPGTPDDLDLGVVDAAWSLEEFPATFGDDDVRWTGTIDRSGLFTPAEDGPNPRRSGSRNNVGDVFVVATLGPESPWKPKAPLRARAHLLVTVPLYVRWDQPEVMP